jgi:protocatechuate 3,4-dioxygenase, beta subunit
LEAKIKMLNRRSLIVGAALAAGCATEKAVAALTPAEIEGPFYPAVRPVETDVDLTRLAGQSQRALGQIIEVTGRVLDRQGRPLSGARVELWQCNAAGRYDHPGDTSTSPLDPGFQSYADLLSGPDGQFRVTSVMPAAYLVPEMKRRRTPHIHFKLRGAGASLTTQMYFPGEALNVSDFIIKQMDEDVRALIAREAPAQEAGARGFAWDIVLDA